MFYIVEIYQRLLYVFFSFLISFFFFYFSKEQFIIFLFSNTFYKTSLFIPNIIEKSFLINLPETLLSLEIAISAVLALVITLPILLSTLRFFFFSCTTVLEYNFFYFN